MSYLDEIEDKEVLEIVRRIRRKAGLQDLLPLPNKESPNNYNAFEIHPQQQQLDHVIPSDDEIEVDMEHNVERDEPFSSQSVTSRSYHQREGNVSTQQIPSIKDDLCHMEESHIYENEYNESLQSIVDIEGSPSYSYHRKFHGLSTVDTFYIPEEEDRYATLSSLSEKSNFVPFQTQRPKSTRRSSPRTPKLQFSWFCIPNTTCAKRTPLYNQVSNDDDSVDECSSFDDDDDASETFSEDVSTSTGSATIMLETVPSCFSNMGEIVQKLASWDSKDRNSIGSCTSRKGNAKNRSDIQSLARRKRSEMDIVQMARSDSLRSSITSASNRSASSSLASGDGILYEAWSSGELGI